MEVADKLIEIPSSNSKRSSGVKPKIYLKPEEVIDYEIARARNEHAKALLNELTLKIKSGEYGSRAAFRQACATALAALAQTLRSVPDNLERKLGVSPEIAAEVGHLIDDSLNDLASEFEMMTTHV